MSITSENIIPNKTSLYFYKASKLLAICGLSGYIKWKNSDYTKSIHNIQKMITACVFIFIVVEVGAFVTQKNLSEKQAADRFIFSFAHPILYSYSQILEYHKEKLKDVIFKLCITLKNVYNDPVVERQMIKDASVYSTAFFITVICTLVSYGFDGISQVSSDGTFVTVITVWPDVTDKSTLACSVRILNYFIWWILMVRVSSAFVLIIITMGCLCYQYKNLQSYFYSLNDIFDEDLDHENAEQKYEEGFKVGVKLHSDTLWCTTQCKAVCSIVYSGQISINIAVFALLMLQLVNSERTLSVLFTIVLTSIAVLFSTAVFMWNAGDVTIEAALVPTAMYFSGWHNCRGQRSKKIRKLLVVAMTQAQKKVVIRSFGIIEVSYQAYVSIVKTSYSAFSLLY